MSDLNRCLHTKNNPDIPTYLLFRVLAEACALWVLLFQIEFYYLHYLDFGPKEIPHTLMDLQNTVGLRNMSLPGPKACAFQFLVLIILSSLNIHGDLKHLSKVLF